MIRKLFASIGKEISGLHEAAYLLAGFTFLSQLLGLFRDRLLSGTFGTGETLDVYYAAFKVPDMIFLAVASLVSISILVPFFTGKKEGGGMSEAVHSIFTFYSIVVLGISLVAFIVAPFLMPILFPGIQGEHAEDLIRLSRIMLLSPIILGISNFFGSIAQVHGRFLLYAISPVLYNLGIIVGVVHLYPLWGLNGLAYGVILGAVLHMCVYIPFLISRRLLPRISFARLRKGGQSVKEVTKLSFPRALALSASSLSVLVLLALASLSGPGSITSFNLAFNLQSIPFAIIGVSYASAAFPLLSRLFTRGDTGAFIQESQNVARHLVFLTMPVATLFIVLSSKIVHVVLGTGLFDSKDILIVGACLSVFAVSVVPQNLTALFVRMFYSMGKTARPFALNVASALVTIILGLVSVYVLRDAAPIHRWFGSMFGIDIRSSVVVLLVASYVCGSIINTILHWFFIEREFPAFSKPLYGTLWKSFCSSVILGVVVKMTVPLYEQLFPVDGPISMLIEGVVVGALGCLAALVFLIVFKSVEVKEMFTVFKGKFVKS